MGVSQFHALVELGSDPSDVGSALRTVPACGAKAASVDRRAFGRGSGKVRSADPTPLALSMRCRVYLAASIALIFAVGGAFRWWMRSGKHRINPDLTVGAQMLGSSALTPDERRLVKERMKLRMRAELDQKD